MEFEIRLDYTVEDFSAYWYGFRWKRAGKKAPKPAPPGALLAAGVVFAAAGPLTAGLMNPWMGGLEIVLGAVCLCCFFRQRKSGVLQRPVPCWAKKSWERWRKAGRAGTCAFSEAGFEFHDAGSDYRCDCAELDSLWEDEGRFYVVLRNRSVFILPKAKFTAGDPADLPAFWRERTGKPVLPVNPEK